MWMLGSALTANFEKNLARAPVETAQAAIKSGAIWNE
jgi:hypothetical protein